MRLIWWWVWGIQGKEDRWSGLILLDFHIHNIQMVSSFTSQSIPQLLLSSNGHPPQTFTSYHDRVKGVRVVSQAIMQAKIAVGLFSNACIIPCSHGMVWYSRVWMIGGPVWTYESMDRTEWQLGTIMIQLCPFFLFHISHTALIQLLYFVQLL